MVIYIVIFAVKKQELPPSSANSATLEEKKITYTEPKFGKYLVLLPTHSTNLSSFSLFSANHLFFFDLW